MHSQALDPGGVAGEEKRQILCLATSVMYLSPWLVLVMYLQGHEVTRRNVQEVTVFMTENQRSPNERHRGT